MFNFFKKIEENNLDEQKYEFDIELIGCALAYEVAKADGSIDSDELEKIKVELTKRSNILGLDSDEVLKTIEIQSNESVSFNDFINQINDNFLQDQKLEMIDFLWQTAYADNILDVDEERLIRRIADMIRIKDMQVLKLKDKAKQG
ncbi:MAG: TerB family tellurite resistance protein [Gammaproteobacteria bacterium]